MGENEARDPASDRAVRLSVEKPLRLNLFECVPIAGAPKSSASVLFVREVPRTFRSYHMDERWHQGKHRAALVAAIPIRRKVA